MCEVNASGPFASRIRQFCGGGRAGSGGGGARAATGPSSRAQQLREPLQRGRAHHVLLPQRHLLQRHAGQGGAEGAQVLLLERAPAFEELAPAGARSLTARGRTSRPGRLGSGGGSVVSSTGSRSAASTIAKEDSAASVSTSRSPARRSRRRIRIALIASSRSASGSRGAARHRAPACAPPPHFCPW